MKTTISTKGQVVLPADLRAEDDIEPGQEFTIERVDIGEYLLKRTQPVPDQGLVKLLLGCPVSDEVRCRRQRIERAADQSTTER